MSDPTAEPPIIHDVSDRISRITLNRPARLNAVSPDLYRALTDAIATAERDDSVRALVLTGQGRAFCAGADLKAHAESTMTRADRRDYARVAQRANLALQRCAKPVVAAVNGAAVGAGLELALSCDFIVVSEDARLRLPEVSLATFPGGAVMHTLPERVGMAKAREIILLGDFFSGRDALEMGLASLAVSAADVMAEACALAGRLAAQAPLSMLLARRLLRRAPRMRRRQVMAAEARSLERCMATEDWREGVMASLEKRTPSYTGR
jgi:enoyl-CoA hydratase